MQKGFKHRGLVFFLKQITQIINLYAKGICIGI